MSHNDRAAGIVRPRSRQRFERSGLQRSKLRKFPDQ